MCITDCCDKKSKRKYAYKVFDYDKQKNKFMSFYANQRFKRDKRLWQKATNKISHQDGTFEDSHHRGKLSVFLHKKDAIDCIRACSDSEVWRVEIKYKLLTVGTFSMADWDSALVDKIRLDKLVYSYEDRYKI